MKKILIIIGMLFYICFHASVSICSEKKQTWGEWLTSKLTFGRPETNIARAKEGRPTMLAAGIASAGIQFAYPDLTSRVGEELLKRPHLLASTVIGIGFGWVALSINAAISIYQTGRASRVDAVTAIKDALEIVVGNKLLYPTYSSRINVLLKKDEFLDYIKLYIQDDYGLLNEACSQLIQTINDTYRQLKEQYGGDQKQQQGTQDSIFEYKKSRYTEQMKEELEIDKHMNLLRAQIMATANLDERITLLEQIAKEQPQDTPAKMNAYLSVYKRTKAQLEMEAGLSPSELENKTTWRTAAQTSYKSDSVQKKKMSPEEREKYRKEYVPEISSKIPGLMTEEEIAAYKAKGEALRSKAEEAQKALLKRRKQEQAAQ